MILDKFIDIKVSGGNINHFISLEYNIRPLETMTIPIEHLPDGSHKIVNVKCDICGNEKSIEYRFYLKNIKKYNFYSCCKKCAAEKLEKTCLEKYGVKNQFQSDKIKDKIKETCVEKYGVENPFQNNEIKNKIKVTCLEKYGVVNPSSNKNIKEKRKETMNQRHGVDYYPSSKEYIDKSKKTYLEKYGTENPFDSEIINKKSKETMMIKYGVDHPMKSKEIVKNTINTKIKNGTILSEKERDDYYNYWLKVHSITKKCKKHLFENWDGKDYYDDEYIKDNFSLNSGSKEYPTIDHKISVKYGFDNDISPEEIGHLENLCITKRTINSSKNKNNEYAIS